MRWTLLGNVVLWTARLAALGLLGLVGVFMLAQGAPPLGGALLQALQTWGFFAAGAGLVAGLFRPRLGGAFVLGGMAAFYGAEWASGHGLPEGWVFPAIALVGGIYLGAGFLRQLPAGH